MTNLSKPTRLKHMVELKMMGFSDLQVADKMKEEGYRKVSETTVWRYLKNIDFKFEDPNKMMINKLYQDQLRDIALGDTALRLKWRAHLLDKIFPTKLHEEVTVRKEEELSLEDYDDSEVEQLREVARLLEQRAKRSAEKNGEG